MPIPQSKYLYHTYTIKKLGNLYSSLVKRIKAFAMPSTV